MNTFLLIYLCIINVVTFVLRGRDKRKANTQGRRISEKQLLWLTACGGGAGALAGQHLFRHKTLKIAFVWKFYAILLLWCGIGIYFLFRS